MTKDVGALMALPHRDDLTVCGALDEVAGQVLGEPTEGLSANFPLQLAEARPREVADDAAVVVMALLSI